MGISCSIYFGEGTFMYILACREVMYIHAYSITTWQYNHANGAVSEISTHANGRYDIHTCTYIYVHTP